MITDREEYIKELEKEFKKHLFNLNILIEENKKTMHSNSTYKITITNGTAYVSCELYDEPLNNNLIKEKYIVHTCENITMALGKEMFFRE